MSAAGQVMLGNALGVYRERCKAKHKDSPVNCEPTSDEIAQPIKWEDFEKYLATSNKARNWVAHFPRVTGCVTGVGAGIAYDRPGEAACAGLFVIINALPLLNFEASYKAKAALGIPASLALTFSGLQARDPWQFANGLAALSYLVVQAKVPNSLAEEQMSDRLFIEKLKDRLGSDRGDSALGR